MSSVVAFANADVPYFGDIKLVCWLSFINWAPTPLLLPDGFKKNQTSLLTFDFVNCCLYQYFATDWFSLVKVRPFWELHYKVNLKKELNELLYISLQLLNQEH